MKESKYKNRPLKIDGMRFASKKEAKRFQELKLLQRAGEIFDLKCQVKIPIHVNQEMVGSYIADFVYWDKDGNKIVEDVKGFKTPIYKFKKRLIRAIYGIQIKEI